MKICCIGDLCADLILPYGEVRKHLSNLKKGSVDYSEVQFQQGAPAAIPARCSENSGRIRIL